MKYLSKNAHPLFGSFMARPRIIRPKVYSARYFKGEKLYVCWFAEFLSPQKVGLQSANLKITKATMSSNCKSEN
jgi:hypothetical protein